MTEYVEAEYNGIPYRAHPYEPSEDGTITWQVEYRQNPKEHYWGPRGVFTERDGKFITSDG